jgi:hypothetical protein
MGFSYTKAQLLSSPPYIFTVFASLATSWLSDKIRLRWPILIGQSIIAIVGLLIVLYPKPPGVRYFGLFLATWGTQGNIPASLAYGNNQTAKVQKRAVVAAAMISVGAAGGVTGSTIFQSKDAPVSGERALSCLRTPADRAALSPRHVGHDCNADSLLNCHLLHVDASQAAEPAGGPRREAGAGGRGRVPLRSVDMKIGFRRSRRSSGMKSRLSTILILLCSVAPTQASCFRVQRES